MNKESEKITILEIWSPLIMFFVTIISFYVVLDNIYNRIDIPMLLIFGLTFSFFVGIGITELRKMSWTKIHIVLTWFALLIIFIVNIVYLLFKV